MVATTSEHVLETKFSIIFERYCQKHLIFLNLSFLSIKHYKAIQAKIILTLPSNTLVDLLFNY